MTVELLPSGPRVSRRWLLTAQGSLQAAGRASLRPPAGPPHPQAPSAVRTVCSSWTGGVTVLGSLIPAAGLAPGGPASLSCLCLIFSFFFLLFIIYFILLGFFSFLASYLKSGQ